MARKTIDIGSIGNDGTGDSIRDAFRKVNDNFRELYSSLGLGERLQFKGLDDTPNSYVGQENALLTVNTTEDAVTFRRLIAGTGVQIDFSTDENSIILSNLLSDLSGDSRPNLGGALNAQSGGVRYPIGNLIDLSVTSEAQNAKAVMEIQHGSLANYPDRLAANKGYVDTKVSLGGATAIDPITGAFDSSFGTMTGPLILSRDPEPDDDIRYNGLIAATKRYVDNSGFGSAVNLYVATNGLDDRPNLSRSLQGRSLAYAYRTLEAALKKAEELVLDAPIEMGPYRKILTYGQGQGQCYLADIDFTNGIPVGTAAVFTLFMSADNIALVSPGSLYLPGDKLTIVGAAIEPTRIQILTVNVLAGTGGRGSIATWKVLTTGVYSSVPGSTNLATTATNVTGGSTFGSGATFDITYKLNSIQVINSGSGYGLVSITVIGGGGTGATARANVVGGQIQGVTVTNKGSGYTSTPTLNASLPRFFIFVSNAIGTDFTGDVSLSTPESIRARDLREGLLLRGETSGAIAQILAHTGALYTGAEPARQQTEIFDVDILSGTFISGEVISYGDVTKAIQISILVESGIYEENYPLRVPKNVAIIGDEFRRVIVRPKTARPNAPLAAMSSSPWAFLNFRRDPIFDGMTVTELLYGYHYLNDPTIPVRPLINNDGNRRSAAEILDLNREFIKTQVIGWINNQIENAVLGAIFYQLEYDQDLCSRDVGLIIDAIVYDLKFGGYSRTLSAALKYFQSVSALYAITNQDQETQAGILRINTLAQAIIVNSKINVLYSLEGVEFNLSSPSNTLLPPVDQIIDLAYVAENGADTVISTLINEIITVISLPSGDVNFPKDNDRIDVFLCNDADIIRAVTCQGHSSFMMVLDPEGQILTKSPYCQESACFSLSTGSQTFAGGMFVDGFTGNQRFFIDSTASAGIFVNVSGLLRSPEIPCSFIVNDTIYRVNYFRNFNYGILSQGNIASTTVGGFSSCQLVLDELTPFTGSFTNTVCVFSGAPGPALITVSTGHSLQVRAIIQFQSTGNLPSGIQPFKDYYVVPNSFTETTFRITADWDTVNITEITSTGTGTVTFRRVFEILMPGNKSMLSNDYTQVNDMGYGLVVANGGLTESVSMFTYYCHISYFALSGGQIRSIGGSSSHGNYGLVAKGSDPLEVPTPVGLYHSLSQGATVYSTGAGYINQKEDVFIFVTYDDYFPLAGSELEINHGNSFVRYAISSVTLDDLANKRARLSIQSAGGLESAVNNGQRITIRQNSFVVLTGDVVGVATRPSTALVLNDGDFVYRVLEFTDYNSTFDKDIIAISNINLSTNIITTTIPHRQQAGYTIKIAKLSGTLPTIIVADQTGPPETIGNVYYILANSLTATQFKISTTKNGSELNLSGGGSYTGLSQIKPYGLALTQLRENYSYTQLDIYPFQPFQTPGSLINCTIDAGTDSVLSTTTLAIGTQIRFTATSYPNEIATERHYWIVTQDYNAGVSFKITDQPPIEASHIGLGTYNTSTGRISGLKSTRNLSDTQRLRPRTAVTITGASGTGTIATVIFGQRQRPPFLAGQTVNISGITPAGYNNATATVLSCTTTTLTYSNSTTAAFISGGTIAIPTGGIYGTLPTDAAIAIGGVIDDTEILISGSAGSPLSGVVFFDIEGIPLTLTGTGSNVRYGTIIGDQGQTTLAVLDLAQLQESRVLNSQFVYEGEKYTINSYVANPGGELYSLITLNSPLHVSAVRYRFPISFKSGVAVPSLSALGTLIIRISLVRVTSHDFLEIGTGSYADTNYPNDIFGLAVNDFNSVPLYTTDIDVSGSPITRSQVQERDVGRVFFVTTDQYGNFSVGPFFKVDQGTGTVTFAASIALSQLDGLGFKRGATVSEFSVDDRMLDETNDTVPTEGAVTGYISRRLGTDRNGIALLDTNLIPPLTGGFLALNGATSMKGNLNLNNYNIVNLGAPIASTDAARLVDINLTNLLDNDGINKVFSFTEISAAQIIALTGDKNEMSNFTVIGDVTFDFNPGDSTINVIRTNISSGVITDTEVNSSAGIMQSKLTMNSATTRVNAVGIGQADRGLASFDDSQFTATNGWITVKNNGISLSKLAQIGPDQVLGYSGSSFSADVAAVNFTTVVDEGGAVKKSQFAGGTGYLKRTNTTVGNHTADAHYSLITDDANATANTLVIRDANADFSARIITVDQLNLKTTSTGTYQALKSNQVTTTSGYTELYGYNGGGGSSFVGVQIGAGTSLNKTNYNNNEHAFRSQNSTSTYGTFSSTGLSLGTLTITAGALASCTSISTGAEATAGSVTGRWTLVGTSRWESTYAADLAEYYEGDNIYEVGTVLIFGGDKEVTVTDREADTRVAGVVSDTAAYSMYSACPGMKNQLALQGRVACKVKGKIFIGDILITSSTPGVARSTGTDIKPGTMIGKALENYDSDDIGIISISVGRT